MPKKIFYYWTNSKYLKCPALNVPRHVSRTPSYCLYGASFREGWRWRGCGGGRERKSYCRKMFFYVLIKSLRYSFSTAHTLCYIQRLYIRIHTRRTAPGHLTAFFVWQLAAAAAVRERERANMPVGGNYTSY